MNEDRAAEDGYALALTHLESVFERLMMEDRLNEGCRECPLMRELEKLQYLSKAARVERVEHELGYCLFEIPLVFFRGSDKLLKTRLNASP